MSWPELGHHAPAPTGPADLYARRHQHAPLPTPDTQPAWEQSQFDTLPELEVAVQHQEVLVLPQLFALLGTSLQHEPDGRALSRHHKRQCAATQCTAKPAQSVSVALVLASSAPSFLGATVHQTAPRRPHHDLLLHQKVQKIPCQEVVGRYTARFRAVCRPN